MSYNLIFFGSPQNSAELLRELDRDPRFAILAVITQPDRPAGRGQKQTPTPVAKYAESHNIPTLKPARHPQKKHLLKKPQDLKTTIAKIITKHEKNFVAAGASTKIDLILAYEYGQLIPQSILDLAVRGGLNIHFSLLPAYRGPAPLPYQILNNEKQTGITVIKMTEKFDQGKIIYQKAYEIEPTDTTQSLHSRLSKEVLKIIPDLLDLPDNPILQPPTPNLECSYFPRLKRSHGFVEWKDFTQAISGENSEKVGDIERKIRALSPWPGVWTVIKSPALNKKKLDFYAGMRLKILSADLKNAKLLPKTVQLEGRPPQPWKEIKKSLKFY